MAQIIPITFPLLNPNEPGALLAAVHITAGQFVKVGDGLCTLETTKTTAELAAEGEGFVVGLRHAAGETIMAGDILCYLSDSPDASPPATEDRSSEEHSTAGMGIRISKPALRLAQEHSLDLSQFAKDVLITESMIRDLLNRTTRFETILGKHAFDSNAILVYGAGGHGKALIDLLRVLGTYPIAGIVDDDPAAGSEFMGIPVLGGETILKPLIEKGVHLAVNAVGGIGNIQTRIKVFERLSQAGLTCPTLVHPTAYVEPGARLADGVQVMPHAYVGSESRIGFGAIINTGAIVSHDCVIGDYANLSPGAILAGEVVVGAAALIGMGVTINLRVKVGENSRIGNGATVKLDVPAGGLVHAGTIWPE